MQKKQGFTLIELMIVVAIVAVLAAIAMPQYQKFLAKTKRSEAIIILSGLHTAQMAYYGDHSKYVIGNYATVKSNLGFEIQSTAKYYNLGTLDVWNIFPGPEVYYGAFLEGDLDGNPDGIYQDDWFCIVYPINPGGECDCAGKPAPSGVPVLLHDDISNQYCS